MSLSGQGNEDCSYDLVLAVYLERRDSIIERIFERLTAAGRETGWQEAEDAYAELFPQALKGFSLDKVSEAHDDLEAATENYLVKAGVNRAIDRYRHERGWSKDIQAAGGKREIPTDPQIVLEKSDRPVEVIELWRQMQALFADSMELPEKDREMFWAYHFKGQKIKEISGEQGVSERWVIKRVKLCTKRLGGLHARPAFVPLFLYQLIWRIRDVVTPAGSLVAQQESVTMPIAKLCAVGCAAAISIAGPAAYKEIRSKKVAQVKKTTTKKKVRKRAPVAPLVSEPPVVVKPTEPSRPKAATKAPAAKRQPAPTESRSRKQPAQQQSTPVVPAPKQKASSSGTSIPDVGALDP